MKKVGIVGYGHVGKAMHKIFPDAIIYDSYDPDYNDTQEQINKECGLAIICVPTNALEDGGCDISIVKSSVAWLETPLILVKSTVEPGTTDSLKTRYKKRICMSPEYFGESKYWVPESWTIRGWPFLIVGGDDKDVTEIFDYFIPMLGPTKSYFKCGALEAELIKYMENSYLATKVTFTNEMYKICQVFGADWYKVWEGWALDPRVEKSHSAVFPEDKGFAGKCLPKDVSAIVRAAQKAGYEPEFLKEVLSTNAKFRVMNNASNDNTNARVQSKKLPNGQDKTKRKVSRYHRRKESTSKIATG